MTEETGLDPEEARLQRTIERYAKVLGGDRCEFGKGVKLITKEKRPKRALDWFRRFIRSKWESEEEADPDIADYRAKGFGIMRVDILRRDFKEWKRLDKSRSAKQSAKQSVEKRHQRGRVKSKTDKRLGAWPRERMTRSKEI